MQKTIKVNDDKIKIIVKPSLSRWGNFTGYTVNVNNQKYFFNTLYQQEAMDNGFVKYIKENR